MSYPWHDASVVEEGGTYAVHLAGKSVRTPLRRPLLAPTRALAEALVAEWRGLGDKVTPETMPLNRYMNSVIDTIADNRQSVIDTVTAYAETDLLCYRAGFPQELLARQSEAWDGPLTDLAQQSGAPMIVTTGILPVEQLPESVAILRRMVEAHDDVTLSALHDLTALSGSIVLALAVSEERLSPEIAWTASRVDENWQIEHWGEDDLATEAAQLKRASFMDAARLMTLARSD